MELLVGLQPTELHHGDCVGADADTHRLAREHLTTTRIVVHPPDNPVKRASCHGDETRTPAPYLVRNQHIVNTTDRLVALPVGEDRTRSGTWYTVRYAATQGRRSTIIWPDGHVEERPSTRSTV